MRIIYFEIFGGFNLYHCYNFLILMNVTLYLGLKSCKINSYLVSTETSIRVQFGFLTRYSIHLRSTFPVTYTIPSTAYQPHWIITFNPLMFFISNLGKPDGNHSDL